jgi:hypothetical protein
VPKLQQRMRHIVTFLTDNGLRNTILRYGHLGIPYYTPLKLSRFKIALGRRSRARGSLVEALRYKPEGHRFDSP